MLCENTLQSPSHKIRKSTWPHRSFLWYFRHTSEFVSHLSQNSNCHIYLMTQTGFVLASQFLFWNLYDLCSEEDHKPQFYYTKDLGWFHHNIQIYRNTTTNLLLPLNIIILQCILFQDSLIFPCWVHVFHLLIQLLRI